VVDKADYLQFSGHYKYFVSYRIVHSFMHCMGTLKIWEREMRDQKMLKQAEAECMISD